MKNLGLSQKEALNQQPIKKRSNLVHFKMKTERKRAAFHYSFLGLALRLHS